MPNAPRGLLTFVGERTVCASPTNNAPRGLLTSVGEHTVCASHHLPNFPTPLPFAVPPSDYMPSFLPLLPPDEYPRGNIKAMSGGERVSITPDQSDKMSLGRCANRKGLLYGTGFPGFYPTLWPHVLAMPIDGSAGGHQVALESHTKGAPPEILHVCYPLRTDDRLADIGEQWIDAHARVRKTDWGEGGMVGVGSRNGYDGHRHTFKVYGDETMQRQVSVGMEVAGGCSVTRSMGEGWVGKRC